ncbi:hypothetical protein C5167_031420 [Papaver somniferum]|uniref:Neprosin PEP catalytic domain-containing protein n=1 Tax=Papaver somniferum TaxID=3469 RepID=A0A4Y7K839_PAPSO|nr:uncharacterized protein LOC113293938 [Papaver somniferum]RZC68165.1 hypothetical protein C5167_031420 [Papaver somniferum]
MAPFSGLKITSFVPLVVGLFWAYHVVIQVGGRDIASRLTEEENLEVERQLQMLNKPPIKTIHTRWGVIYDCIEFHKQPAFDNPLLKRHSIPKKVETAHTSPKETLMSRIEGCPKGTVPIRRTTKEDLMRAKYLSSTSNAPGDEYRAGSTLQTSDQKIFGATGVVNVWHPKVNPDQFSGAEIAIKAGPEGQTNEIRFGWTVNPQLYGDDLTSTFSYWTGDGGHNTGCYNTFCSGFVQVDQHYTPAMAIDNMSTIGGTQYILISSIIRERETGHWWLMLENKIQIGYWPRELFPHFESGAEYIYWGGHVKSGQDGMPEMASGNRPDRFTNHTGYFEQLEYKDKDDRWVPYPKIQSIVDCKGSYDSFWDDEHAILHFGGPGGGTCN